MVVSVVSSSEGALGYPGLEMHQIPKPRHPWPPWSQHNHPAWVCYCINRCRDFIVTALTKKIIASLLKIAGYIHNHKILPGNIFGLILKSQIVSMGVFLTFSKDFCWASRAKGIIARDLKFAGYVPHYKILTRNIFGLILKNKMATMGVSLSVIKSVYISLIIGPRGSVCESNL